MASAVVVGRVFELGFAAVVVVVAAGVAVGVVAVAAVQNLLDGRGRARLLELGCCRSLGVGVEALDYA